tara:strand:+ start:185 stop:556 length:372 start_codon:yes stop_codon:yes gene_type:complete
MNIIIKNNELNLNNIRIKNNDKILYNFNSIQLLGIPLLLKEFTYDIIDNFLKVKIKDNDILEKIKLIDDFFYKKFKNYKRIIQDNIIYIKNIMNKKILPKEIYININSLKRKDFILYLNIFTL